MLILAVLVIVFFAGWLANLILGGGFRPRDWGEVGIAGFFGSLVGGLIGNLLGGQDLLDLHFTGIIGSAVGAIVVLVVWRLVRGDTISGAARQ